MKKEILKFLVLALLAIGAGPVSGAVWQWSRTATNNATVDSTINWAEGMSPSSVNDSARSMMARIADYRDDLSGSLLTAGTSTAYTLASHQVFDTLAHMDGAGVAFTAHVTNGASPTLAVDGLAAKSLVASSGLAIPAGTLIANTPYVVTYNNANNEFRLQGGAGVYNIPLGGLLAYTGGSSPSSNFILPAGQCISTTTYATYWVFSGSPGVGPCAGGQFQVLDLRGRTLAALDNLNGTAANRMTSSANGCGVAFTSLGATCGNESYTLSTAQIPSHSHANTLSDPGHTHGNTAITNAFTFTAQTPGAISIPNGTGATIGTSGTGMSINNIAAGGGGAHPTVTPTIAVTYLLRVL